MPGPSRKFLLFAGVPLLLGSMVGTVVGVYQMAHTPPSERATFIQDFLWNPASSSALVAYLTFIICISTIILYQLARSASAITNNERSRVAEEGAESRAPEAPDEVLSDKERAEYENKLQLNRIRFAFTRNRRRMSEEIVRIQRNGFLNLSIGVLFSVVALGILGYPLFMGGDAAAPDWIGFVERFVPRLSVGILVQFIGFFFLRLYVAGENEVHYIRNEITNLESKMIAYHIGAVRKDAVALRDIMKQLVRTERNFILKKGERSLYELDPTYNDIAGLTKAASDLLRKKAQTSNAVCSRDRIRNRRRNAPPLLRRPRHRLRSRQTRGV
jgi:hypothetical protein